MDYGDNLGGELSHSVAAVSMGASDWGNVFSISTAGPFNVGHTVEMIIVVSSVVLGLSVVNQQWNLVVTQRRMLESSSLLSTRSRLDFLWLHAMQHHFVDKLWGILLISLTPVIANCICEHCTLSIKRGGSYRPSNSWVTLQSVLRITVPEVESAVTTGGRESTMDGMERDRIDTVDVGDIPIRASCRWCVAVAFETEIIGRVFFLNILNCASTLDTTDGKARRIREGRHHPGLIFQR